jgi:hypothetical protein
LRIVVLGYLVRCPIGGMAWHHMQYAIGLAELGHDVWFIEDSGDEPWSCYDPTTGATGADPTYGLRFAAEALTRVGLGDRWAYHDALAGRWHGPAADRAADVCRSADLVLNLSHSNVLRPWLHDAPVRALVDTDPVFTQLRHLTDERRRTRALQHNAFFTFGESIGGGGPVPDDGIAWLPTRQPIVLGQWAVTPGPIDGAFTTVMQWDSYPPIEYGGRRYGMKRDSFAPYADLPRRTDEVLEVALGSEAAPRSALRRQGWNVRDPLRVTKDPWTYQRYIRRSKGEFSVAKQGYVLGNCGWFSERSAAYLASGRPVVVQETGFSDWMPTGRGVVAFGSPEEAIAGLREVNERYEAHCRAAREIAEAYFDARKVLPTLIEAAVRNRLSSVSPREGVTI